MIELIVRYDGSHSIHDSVLVVGKTIGVLVRCKDCRHRVFTKDGESNPHDIVCDYHMSDGFDETDFCSYGERKEE